MKKFTAVLLSVVLLVGLLAACSGSEEKADKPESAGKVNKTGYPIVDESITLTMFAPNVGSNEWEDMDYFKEMEKKTNIKFKFNTPPVDSLDTKKNLTFASGDLPDIFYASSLTKEEQVKYGNQGLLIPLEDLIKQYAPNVQKMLDDNPHVKKSITTDDGHIYALPNFNEGLAWTRGPMWYNGEWLKKLGIKKLPETTDELYELLKRFKTDDPNGNGKADEIPLTGFKIEDIRQWFLGAFGVLDPGVYVLDGEVKYGAIQPGYKQYLTYMNKLWDEKLLDHETFSQTDDQKKAKGHDNRVGLFADWFPHFTLGGPDDSTDNPMMRPVKGPDVDKPVLPITDGLSVGQFAITSENKHPEATMRWIDDSYSEEGAVFLNLGAEGKTWKWKDKAKNIRAHVDQPEGFKSMEDYRGTLTPDYGIPVPKWGRKDEIVWEDDHFNDFTVEETEKKLLPVGHVPMPHVYLTKEESNDVSRIRSDLDTYVQQMEAKFITGQQPLSKWDDYVKTIEKMDANQLVKIYSDAYKRYEKK